MIFTSWLVTKSSGDFLICYFNLGRAAEREPVPALPFVAVAGEFHDRTVDPAGYVCTLITTLLHDRFAALWDRFQLDSPAGAG